VSQSKKNDNTRKVVCYCCGTPGHSKPNCKYRTLSCLNCKKVGHLKKICKAKFDNIVNYVEQSNDDLNLNSLLNIESVEVNFVEPYIVKLEVEKKILIFKYY